MQTATLPSNVPRHELPEPTKRFTSAKNRHLWTKSQTSCILNVTVATCDLCAGGAAGTGCPFGQEYQVCGDFVRPHLFRPGHGRPVPAPLRGGLPVPRGPGAGRRRPLCANQQLSVRLPEQGVPAGTRTLRRLGRHSAEMVSSYFTTAATPLPPRIRYSPLPELHC